MTDSTLNDRVTTVGIDLGKSVFHVIGMTQSGRIVLRRKVSREQLERQLVNLQPCLIGIEACAGAPMRSRPSWCT
jgi:transposase